MEPRSKTPPFANGWRIIMLAPKRFGLFSFRTLTALSHGKAPGPEGSAGKLLWATQTQELTNQAMDIQDHFGLIDDPEVAMLNGGFPAPLPLGARVAIGRRHRRDYEKYHCGARARPARRRARGQGCPVPRNSNWTLMETIMTTNSTRPIPHENAAITAFPSPLAGSVLPCRTRLRSARSRR